MAYTSLALSLLIPPHSPLVLFPPPSQAVSPPTQESILIREACYRCIGEGYNHISGSISFQAW
jgi:hypothetical protein